MWTFLNVDFLDFTRVSVQCLQGQADLDCFALALDTGGLRQLGFWHGNSAWGRMPTTTAFLPSGGGWASAHPQLGLPSW